MGFRDATRGTIFFSIADIISRTNPRAIFLENVDNLVSHDSGNTIKTIIKTLEEELGYRVIGVSLDEEGNYVYDRTSFIRNTKNFGLPQNRPRTYIMAFSKKRYGKAVKKLTNALPNKSEDVIFDDVRQVLEDNVNEKYYLSQGYLDTLKKHRARNQQKGNGFGYCVVNCDNDKRMIANTILATGGSGKERNLIWQYKENISGKSLKTKHTPINSEGIRMMTPTEWGRLQGFIGYAFMENNREGFSFPDKMSDGQKYKQFGNSVSIPVIRKMADFMLQCFRTLEEQQVDIVKAMAERKEYITKRDIMEELEISGTQASGILKRMICVNEIKRVSCGRTTRYVCADSINKLNSYSQTKIIIDETAKRGSISNRDVVAVLGGSIAGANNMLSQMTKKGLLVRQSRGKYVLHSIS